MGQGRSGGKMKSKYKLICTLCSCTATVMVCMLVYIAGVCASVYSWCVWLYI